MAIQRLKHKAVEAIMVERKKRHFKSLEDFFQRIDVDFSDAMILTDSGCFYGIEPDMTHKEIAYYVTIHCLSKDNDEPDYYPAEHEDLPLYELLKLETECFGFPVSRHPLFSYSSLLKNKVRKAIDIPNHKGRVINLAGVKITRKVTSTKKHQPMEFVTFEDETDIYECVMFPKVYKEFGDLLNWEKLFVVRGKVEEAWGVYTITIEKLFSLSKMSRENAGKVGN